jgi:hypothetical protein
MLGNGPSLKDVDLCDLDRDDALVFACNRIHTHWSWDAGFRPDVYVCGDAYGNPHLRSDVKLHLDQGYECWIKSDILFSLCNEDLEPNARFWWVDYGAIVHPYQNCFHRRDMRPPSGWHPPHVCNFTGAMNAMVQVAIFNYEISQVLFLGIDGHIKKGRNGNHMSEDYQHTWYGPPMVERINEELYIGHTIIAGELAQRGIGAFNLTPGSAFDQYPNASVEEAIR